jgi:hypothetical protein
MPGFFCVSIYLFQGDLCHGMDEDKSPMSPLDDWVTRSCRQLIELVV